MNNDNSQRMRISLPPGEKLRGTKATYIVKRFASMSSRSTTVLCETENGASYRLKLFNGQHSINNAKQKQIASIAAKWVVLPIDTGVFGGSPFAVYPIISAADTGKTPVAQDVLVRRIIPQMVFVMNKYHQNRILLRDICPEHILYRAQEQQIVYCGFNNMAVLPDRATMTKERGYGQHPSFIAPEVPEYGYSIASDYYALGVTLLSLIRGDNPMRSISWEDIRKSLLGGTVPGINTDYLRKIPYELYSMEDKVLYLVWGLMLPNPKDRWGYGEIRCWCNGQRIPLIRKEGRIPYQYNEPFVVNNIKCWNYRQLTYHLAADRNCWNESTLKRLGEFAGRQKIKVWNQIMDVNKECDLTASGKIFRAIYGMNPALNGLWWEGKKYADTVELVNGAASDENAAHTLSAILKNQSLSFFLRMRKRITDVNETEIQEAVQMEQWEMEEAGKGTDRCIMRFAGSRQRQSFWIHGTGYQKMDLLLAQYSSAGIKLKSISSDILRSKSFQAWLWAKGMERAGTKAKETSIADPEQSFYLLLKLAENASENDAGKRLARKMYLTYGEYAPVYWLVNHIEDYKMVSMSDQILYDRLKNARFPLTDSLDRLSSAASRLVSDYLHFVSCTASNSLKVNRTDLEFAEFSYYPVKADRYFLCTWENNMEVCPAFLKSIGMY